MRRGFFNEHAYKPDYILHNLFARSRITHPIDAASFFSDVLNRLNDATMSVDIQDSFVVRGEVPVVNQRLQDAQATLDVLRNEIYDLKHDIA